MGDSLENKKQGNLVMIFSIEKNEVFSYEGLNLIKKEQISLRECLTKSSVEIVNIDGEWIRVSLEQPVTPQSVIKIPGKGFKGTSL